MNKEQAMQQKLLGMKDLPPEVAAFLEAQKKPAAKDMILGLSGGRISYASRVDSQDTAVKLSKKGGAFDQASRGGGVINNNFWEGKGAFNSLRQLERAKGQFK